MFEVVAGAVAHTCLILYLVSLLDVFTSNC